MTKQDFLVSVSLFSVIIKFSDNKMSIGNLCNNTFYFNNDLNDQCTEFFYSGQLHVAARQ